MPKGSDLLVAALENEGVDRIFGVPGEENLDVVESLRNSSIELILTRHEQGAAFMIFWGLRADKTGERIWSTALPLALTATGFALTLTTDSLPVTLVLLSLVLLGNYAIKGPFFALATEMLPPASAAAGIAAINTLAHLGTGAITSLTGTLRQMSGSFPIALLPLCILTAIGACLVFWIGRNQARAAAAVPST